MLSISLIQKVSLFQRDVEQQIIMFKIFLKVAVRARYGDEIASRIPDPSPEDYV